MRAVVSGNARVDDMPTATGRRCSVWQLPADETCAQAARRVILQSMNFMKFPEEDIEDSVTMVSELATNAFRHATDFGIRGSSPHVGLPELWLYRRGQGAESQLVCKVFDPSRRWSPDEAEEDEVGLRDGGRGLDVVAALSQGCWGVHLTRSQLGQWPVPGKATWFAIPMVHGSYGQPYSATKAESADAGAAHALPRVEPDVPEPLVHDDPADASQAARELVDSLGARGISRVYVRDDGYGQSVVSVRTGLTIWVRDGLFVWDIKSAGSFRHPAHDLAEVVEEVVRIHEELDAADIGTILCPVNAGA